MGKSYICKVTGETTTIQHGRLGIFLLLLLLHSWYSYTGVMAASEIPPQMANFQTFFLAAFYFLLAAKTAHFAHYYFVLNSSLSAQKQHILVFRNTPNCSSVHSGMTGISL